MTDSIDFYQGGKGANQAYAAALAAQGEAAVNMVGAVGDDTAGDVAIESLAGAGVDVSMVRRVIGRPTGRAYIAVTDDGQNSIVVGLGANAFVSPSSIAGSPTPDIAVGQTEVGAAAVEALGRFAIETNARFVVNNGPVVALSDEVLTVADPLVVNEHEAADMLGSTTTDGDPEDLVQRLRQRYNARSVIITLGSLGSVVADGDGVRSHPAVLADHVVDTTGAGDTYVGALAASLALGHSLDTAIGAAARAAAASVQWQGARSPMTAIGRT